MTFWKSRRHGQSKKIGNQKVSLDGYSFASKLEAAVFQILRLSEMAGEIKILQVQDHVYLTDARIGYIPDFKCIDLKTNEEFHVEAKGFEMGVWRLKRKLWMYYGPGPLDVWKGHYLRPVFSERITPKNKRT